MMTLENKEYIALDESGLAMTEGYFPVYNYSAITNEYTEKTDEYLLIGVSIPAYSLSIAPPDVAEGYIVIARNGSWDIIPDYRGLTAYAKDGSGSITVSIPGELANEYTFDVPTTVYDRWTDTGWVTDATKQVAAQIADAEATQAALLSTATQAIVVWQTKLLRGRQLTETEASTLDLWLDYIDQLEAINPELAPDITWPEVPES